MSRRVEAIVTPQLLLWAREGAGYSTGVAAKKLKIPQERLSDWEQGQGQPSVSQLRRLGNLYKRPIAVFYLAEPPRDFSALRDYRRLAGSTPPSPSPQLQFEIRMAQTRREVALDLCEKTDVEFPSFAATVDPHADAEAIGTRIRDIVGMTYKRQIGWRTQRQAFGAWRDAIQETGVLVFQAYGISLDEMRGFSINERPIPVIVVNGKDSLAGRTFSLCHELAHVMLNQAALCDMVEEAERTEDSQNTEVLCNRIAGATLMPRALLLNDPVVRNRSATREWPDDELGALSRRYWVSKEVVLRRLVISGRSTSRFYRRKRKQFEQEYEEAEERKTPGFAPPHTMAISRAGTRFVRLVVDSFNQERITASDLSDYLGIRLKHLPRIEAALSSGPLG